METLEHSLQVSEDTVPIHRVPADVLQRIFSEYVDIPGNAHSLHRATLLTMVCHTWRAIVLDTAELWTKIKLSLDHPLPPLSAISTALSLSRRRPIDIYLHMNRYPEWPDLAYCRKAIELVWEHQERWRSLDLHYSYDPYRLEVRDLELQLQGTLPYLRFLKCKIEAYNRAPIPSYRISVSIHNFVAPRVHHLAIGCYVNTMFTPMDLSHSFLSLESLLFNFSFPGYRRESRVEILRALACLPKLQVLKVITDLKEDHPSTRFNPSSPICLPSLREFIIMSSRDCAIAEWLAIFQAPNLTAIAILPIRNMMTRGFDTFKERFPSLQKIRFDHEELPITFTPYAELSRYVPFLELEISVFETPNLTQLMQTLMQKEDGTYFYLPLHRLEIHLPSSCSLGGNSDDDAWIGALRNLVEMHSWKRASDRNDGPDAIGATLREVHIRSSEDMTPSLRKWFEKNLVRFSCSSTILQDLEEDTVRLVTGEEELCGTEETQLHENGGTGGGSSSI